MDYPGKPVPERQNQSGFTEARDREWQWHQLGHMQIYTSPQTNNHTNTLPLRFLQVGYPSCCPTNSIKTLKTFCLLCYPIADCDYLSTKQLNRSMVMS